MGVNEASDAAASTLIAAYGSPLPWLQDTTEQNISRRWPVVYRDVLILDGANRPVGTLNLTTHDLTQAANRATLRQMILDAAHATDSDADRLRDDWELLWFDSLAPRPDGDDDGDGCDNFTEMALATNPRDPGSVPMIVASRVGPTGAKSLNAVFHRLAGDWLEFTAETSTDLLTWGKNPTDILRLTDPKNLYDGRGGVEVRAVLGVAPMARSATFLRLRATPRLN